MKVSMIYLLKFGFLNYFRDNIIGVNLIIYFDKMVYCEETNLETQNIEYFKTIPLGIYR